MTKMTNSVALATAIEVLANEDKYSEVVEKLKNIKASIDKKSASKSGKPTAKQTENEGFKAEILDFLADGEKYTVTDILKGVPSLADFSTSKVSALVRQLKECGKVNREEINRKAYFSLATTDNQ